MNLEYIDPLYIAEIWDTILPGLKKIHKHGDSWRPEDVYMSLKMNQSVLHVAYRDNQYIGFIVTQTEQTVSGPSLHIWCTYSEANDESVFIETIPTLKEWAKTVHAKRITFKSPRKGWEKLGRKIGFEPLHTIYSMRT